MRDLVLRSPSMRTLTEEPPLIQLKAEIWRRAYQCWTANSLSQLVPYTWAHMSRAGLSASTAIMTMCEQKYGTMVYSNNYGPQVIRLSSAVAVKFGHGVTRQEALNQHFAFQHASCEDFKVPQVFSFLVNTQTSSFASVGYIVMEYIDGVAVKDLAPEVRHETARKVATAMRQLSAIPLPAAAGPGPIMKGGIASGYFWGNNGSPVPFKTLDSMTTWINKQLAVTHPSANITFAIAELGFRHMDINVRNILVTADKRICFVDWQFSGFFPSLLELIHLKTCEWECHSFSTNLLANLPGVSQGLQDPRYPLLLQVMSNNIRYGVHVGEIEPP